MKRAALYVRVSTQEQKFHGLSVDSQIIALKEYCKEHSYAEVGIYNDAGISARKKFSRRPALVQLIEDCKEGKIDIILFTKLDRWFRSVADYYQVQAVLDERKIPWRAIWEDYETETSSGVFKVNIMLSVAQSEADRTSERVKSVNEYRRAQGCYLGGAPTGYKVVKNDLLKDKATEDAVQAAFDTFALTRSVVKSIAIAHEHNLALGHETFRRMLKSKTYCGEAYGGYQCEPYITREQYEENQRIIESRRLTSPCNNKFTYIFTGILKCPVCAGPMVGSGKVFTRGDKHYKYKYYKCYNVRNFACDNKHLLAESVVEDYLIAHLDEEMNSRIVEVESNSRRVEIEKEIKKLQSKLNRVGDRYEEGDITKEEYKEKRTTLLMQIDTLRNEVPVSAPTPLPSDWKDIYFELDDEHKKSFWAGTLSRIVPPKTAEESFKITF